ncbi:Protein SlyX [Klebsiella grimontii]|nr:Protein SlyX [Klebsiella grimontii]
MNDTSPNDILLLKQRLAEQAELIHALQEQLNNREREIDHLQAQLDELRQPFRKGIPPYRTDGS